MKELTSATKIYILLTYVAGLAIFMWQVNQITLTNGWMTVILSLLASLTLILKVEGPTNRSHYTFSFLVYGFAFTVCGIPEAILVIVVSNLVEGMWSKQLWYILTQPS